MRHVVAVAWGVLAAAAAAGLDKHGGKHGGMVISAAPTATAQLPLPCCPATCPQCSVQDSQRRQHRQQRSGRRKPGRLLQADGGLLRAARDEARHDRGYAREKGGVLRPVLLEAADFRQAGPWQPPWEACGPEDDCPCHGCMCCFTETVVCTVQAGCPLTYTSTTTSIATRTLTRTASVMSSVTARIIFTVTDTQLFRSTLIDSVTATNFSTVIFTMQTLTTSTSLFFVTTETFINEGSTVLTVSVTGGPTVSTTSVSVVLLPGATTLTLPPRTVPLTRLDISTRVTGVGAFTVYGLRTLSTTLTLTRNLIVTQPTATLVLTPGTTVASETARLTLSTTLTDTVTRCLPCVETTRVTPTRTIVRKIGTALPCGVACCPDAPGSCPACPGHC